MKVIIAGSRHITDYVEVCSAIRKSDFHITEVVSGCAKGPDTLGIEWANNRRIPVKRFPADWSRGSGAGLARNWEMSYYAEGLIALWDGQSKGTKHMIDAARSRGLQVHVHLVQ